jgi:hypothetical protein
MVVFDPHLPTGWENVSIDALPVGTNTIAFSRAKTASGIEYRVGATEAGWTFILKAPEVAGASYYLNGRAVPFSASGIRMSGRKNLLLVTRCARSSPTTGLHDCRG